VPGYAAQRSLAHRQCAGISCGMSRGRRRPGQMPEAVGEAGSDLHVMQVSASVRHGRDVGVKEHVRVRPGDLDAAVSAA
jgi:hypothetical protein